MLCNQARTKLLAEWLVGSNKVLQSTSKVSSHSLTIGATV